MYKRQHLHVPAEDPADAIDVRDLGEPGLELVECLGSGHDVEAYIREPAESRPNLELVRTLFALCWLIIVSGVAFYTVIGVTHH